ncbi:hypothetical protein NP233_g237 [Leucocoprinus birnbaumii]|uniref:Uncharacterized protein n=1 Tax=Leucocoprinus birnbaumii TaxID=56174 RepID=A0AAD5W290_9AGAR|nr:hypothetical protein NP233_g237 [Leucocoprinus birnbaumii]
MHNAYYVSRRYRANFSSQHSSKPLKSRSQHSLHGLIDFSPVSWPDEPRQSDVMEDLGASNGRQTNKGTITRAVLLCFHKVLTTQRGDYEWMKTDSTSDIAFIFLFRNPAHTPTSYHHSSCWSNNIVHRNAVDLEPDPAAVFGLVAEKLGVDGSAS